MVRCCIQSSGKKMNNTCCVTFTAYSRKMFNVAYFTIYFFCGLMLFPYYSKIIAIIWTSYTIPTVYFNLNHHPSHHHTATNNFMWIYKDTPWINRYNKLWADMYNKVLSRYYKADRHREIKRGTDNKSWQLHTLLSIKNTF